MKNLIPFLTKKGIYLLAVFFLSSLQGCMCYYKAQTANTVTAQEVRKYDSANKYFILHRDTIFWRLSMIEINNEILAGKLSGVPAVRWKYDITGSTKAAHRYKQNDGPIVLNMVHIYLKSSSVPVIDSGGHIKVALTDIKRIEVYQKAKGRTTLSWVLPPVLVVGITALIVQLSFASSFMSGSGY
jgi:hypothetical protein